MGPPPTEALRPLTTAERTTLEWLKRTSSERVDRVRRAVALLAVAHGQTYAQAARQAGLQSSSTVAALVGRFNRRGMAAVSIAAGRGRTPPYDAVARAPIVATAQRPPDRKTDGTATWSLSTLERTPRREAFAQVGATTIRRVLEDAGSS